MFLFLSTSAHSLDKLSCGEYLLKGRLVKRISYNQFQFDLYPETKRQTTINLAGNLTALYIKRKNINIQILVDVIKAGTGRKVQAKFVKFLDVVPPSSIYKSGIQLKKVKKCGDQ